MTSARTSHWQESLTLTQNLRLVGRRTAGLATLRRGIDRLLSWCEENEIDPSTITRPQMKTYRHDLVESGLKPRSVGMLLWSAKVYLDHLVKTGIRKDHPGLNLSVTTRGTTLPRNLLKESDLEKVLDRLSRFDQAVNFRRVQEVYRAHVVAEVLYASGIRIAEAAGLFPEDLDLERQSLKVREGKGGRERTAFLSTYACGVLRVYLKLRPLILHQGFGHRERLFGMSENNLSSFLSRELKTATRHHLLSPVSAHGLRHMVGWHLLRSGANLRSIQNILGHSQIKSTEIYTHVDKESLRAVLDSFHPRGKERENAVENRHDDL